MDGFYVQLGTLAAALVGAEFSEPPPPVADVQVMLRSARALAMFAAQRLRAVEMVGQDEDALHVKDTPCVGPCVYLWSGAKQDADVRRLVQSMQGTESAATARTLYCELVQLKPSGASDVETYQLCQITGFPCATFSDVGDRCTSAASASLSFDALREAVRESALLVRYAEHVAQSRILALQAGHVDLSGGASHAALVSACRQLVVGRGGEDAVRSFYALQPDFRSKSLTRGLVALSGCETADDELDFLVTGAVVEPLVQQASAHAQDALRNALQTQWTKHVCATAADFSDS